MKVNTAKVYSDLATILGVEFSNLQACNYRPQRSWAKVIFSQACVKNSVHGGGGEGVCLSACWDTHPLGADTPQTRHPRTRHPLGADTPREQTRPPWTRHPLGADPPGPDTPPGLDPPGSKHPQGGAPPGADSAIRSTSGRNASYWNAFLFSVMLMISKPVPKLIFLFF